LNQPAKLYGSGKSMIFRPIARTGKVCSNRKDGGLLRRTKTRGSSEGARSAKQLSEERTGGEEARSQQVLIKSDQPATLERK